MDNFILAGAVIVAVLLVVFLVKKVVKVVISLALLGAVVYVVYVFVIGPGTVSDVLEDSEFNRAYGEQIDQVTGVLSAAQDVGDEVDIDWRNQTLDVEGEDYHLYIHRDSDRGFDLDGRVSYESGESVRRMLGILQEGSVMFGPDVNIESSKESVEGITRDFLRGEGSVEAWLSVMKAEEDSVVVGDYELFVDGGYVYVTYKEKSA